MQVNRWWTIRVRRQWSFNDAGWHRGLVPPIGLAVFGEPIALLVKYLSVFYEIGLHFIKNHIAPVCNRGFFLLYSH